MRQMSENETSGEILDAAIEVHRTLGPGLLESIYHSALFHELVLRGLNVRKEVRLPIQYKGIQLDGFLRIDLLVNDEVIVEIKSVKSIDEVHRAQILTYLKLSKIRVGLLLNFNERLLKNGVHRLVL